MAQLPRIRSPELTLDQEKLLVTLLADFDFEEARREMFNLNDHEIKKADRAAEALVSQDAMLLSEEIREVKISKLVSKHVTSREAKTLKTALHRRPSIEENGYCEIAFCVPGQDSIKAKLEHIMTPFFGEPDTVHTPNPKLEYIEWHCSFDRLKAFKDMHKKWFDEVRWNIDTLRNSLDIHTITAPGINYIGDAAKGDPTLRYDGRTILSKDINHGRNRPSPGPGVA